MPGTIIFKPLQANLTHNTEWIGKMDPYCLYHMGDKKIKGQICKKGGKEPHWEDAVTVPVTDQTTCVVDLKDKDILIDDKIGTFEIDLHEVETQGRLKKWYPIFYKEKPAGEILMETIFSSDTSSFVKPDVTKMSGMSQPTTMPHEGLLGHGTIPPNTTSTYPTTTHTIPIHTTPTYAMPTMTGSQPTLLSGSQPDSIERYAQESLMHGVDPLNTLGTNLYNSQQGLSAMGSQGMPLGTGSNPMGGLNPMSSQGMSVGTGSYPMGEGYEKITTTTYTATNIGTHGTHTHTDHYPNQQMPFGHGHHMPSDDKNPMKYHEEFREEDLSKRPQ